MAGILGSIIYSSILKVSKVTENEAKILASKIAGPRILHFCLAVKLSFNSEDWKNLKKKAF